MTKVDLLIGPSWTSNCFDLNFPENAMPHIYKKDGQSNLFLDSLKEVNRVPIEICKKQARLRVFLILNGM
uniref:Uncharacterized protein n=1 Tax=Solanum lycopersicum TaxID=4081 RepID=A0A3Q7IU09_SOLLC